MDKYNTNTELNFDHENPDSSQVELQKIDDVGSVDQLDSLAFPEEKAKIQKDAKREQDVMPVRPPSSGKEEAPAGARSNVSDPTEISSNVNSNNAPGSTVGLLNNLREMMGHPGKIHVKNPIVDIKGDQMAAIIWQNVKEQLILPFLDIELKTFDLTI
jgi:hypothetical protein